ncbi:hypothetical protein [Kitasatospora sp. NPDC004272]
MNPAPSTVPAGSLPPPSTEEEGTDDGATHAPSPVAAPGPDGSRLAVGLPGTVAVIDLPAVV